MIKSVRAFVKKNKHLSEILLIAIKYFSLLAVALFWPLVYEQGALGTNIFGIIVIAIVWMYRLLLYTLVPCIIVTMILNRMAKKHERK